MYGISSLTGTSRPGIFSTSPNTTQRKTFFAGEMNKNITEGELEPFRTEIRNFQDLEIPQRINAMTAFKEKYASSIPALFALRKFGITPLVTWLQDQAQQIPEALSILSQSVNEALENVTLVEPPALPASRVGEVVKVEFEAARDCFKIRARSGLLPDGRNPSVLKKQ